MIQKLKILSCLLLMIVSIRSVSQVSKNKAVGKGSITITFENTINHEEVVLNDSIYINPFGERYAIAKLRYYVSNVELHGKSTVKDPNRFHLVDEAKPWSRKFVLPISPGTYNSISFLLGVDSLHNVSGAQTGALDPLNDMFWTWNSGYVMAKFEGHSPSSKLPNNTFEYHIGGFSGEYSVLKKVSLDFPLNHSIKVLPGHSFEIIVEADLTEWWQGVKDIRIAENPLISTPGVLAKAVSDNYGKMFVVQQVTEPTSRKINRGK